MIKLLVVDVDGTLTDGRYYFSNNGDVMKSFNTKDFDYLGKIQDLGVRVLIMTTSSDDVVWYRVKSLPEHKHKRLILVQGVENKLKYLSEFLAKHELSWGEIACIGDWDNDLGILKKVAIAACPLDASEEVIKTVESKLKDKSYLCLRRGGEGAVAEFVNHLKNVKEIECQNTM